MATPSLSFTMCLHSEACPFMVCPVLPEFCQYIFSTCHSHECSSACSCKQQRVPGRSIGAIQYRFVHQRAKLYKSNPCAATCCIHLFGVQPWVVQPAMSEMYLACSLKCVCQAGPHTTGYSRAYGQRTLRYVIQRSGSSRKRKIPQTTTLNLW